MVARKLEKFASDYEQISEQKRMSNYCNKLIFFVIHYSENLKIASDFASDFASEKSLTYLRQSGKIEIGDKKQWQLKEFSQK